MTRWLWQLKWALVIAIFAGPAIAYFSFTDAQRVERVMANGTPFTAAVVGGTIERGRRGARSYNLELGWVDAEGAPHHDNLDISSDYANQIFVDDYITIETAEIRYLPVETAEPVVLTADAPEQIENDHMMMWLGIGAGIAGLIFAPIWFWLEAKRNRRDDDIDAELARMRGQAQ
jgi:hypothetical protein